MELLNNAVTIFIPLFVIVWLLVKKQRSGGALLLVSLCTILINVVLKEIFRIDPRPGNHFQLSQYSFPSLSSQLAVTFWFYFALRKKKIIFFVIAFLLVMFVSFQRILSGQHSISDVIGGVFIGFWIVVVFRYFERKTGDTWTRLGIEERFPDPLTPLSQDIFTNVYTLSAMEALKELNLQSTHFTPQYKTFNGYLYHNFDLQRLPKLKLIKFIVSFYAHASNAEREYDRVILNRDTAFFSKLEQVNLPLLSNSKLLEYLEQIQRKFIRRMGYETKVALLSEGVMLIAKLMTKLSFGKELGMSAGEVESITVDKQLTRLAKDLRSDNIFNRKFNRFIQKYRYRLITYDLISPSWEEKPDAVLNIIRRYGSDPINKVFVKSPGKKTLLQAAPNRWVWLARKYYLLKEARYDSRMIYFYWLRKILLRIRKNFVKTNILEQDEDVFFISLQNLKDLANRRKGDLQKLRQHIRVKKEEWKKQFELNPPYEFSTYERKNWKRNILPVTELKGVIASRGKAVGICKVISSIDEFSKLKKEEILVAPTTNPAWTSLFGLAGAVITETGGVLSHAAIVAREYGIPCLVNVREATHMLRDGDVLEVDANNGIVKILH